MNPNKDQSTHFDKIGFSCSQMSWWSLERHRKRAAFANPEANTKLTTLMWMTLKPAAGQLAVK